MMFLRLLKQMKVAGITLAAFAVMDFAGEILVADEPAGQAVVPINLNDSLPYGQKPIDYHGADTQNVVEDLQRRLNQGEVQFSSRGDTGYLQSVLDALEISPTSQMLVFSKTALNPKLVSPQNPRAIYFNEDCYVAWVPGASSLEIAAVDPQKGWIFYTLNQSHNPENDPPKFTRESQCLVCHAGQSSLHVPGGLVRGFLTDREGNPTSGYSQITDDLSFDKRFGGWYVTGTQGGLSHRGNRLDAKFPPAESLLPAPDNVTDLSAVLDKGKYLTNHSDLVAQLLLHHQIEGQNLLIRVGHEARLGRKSDAEEWLVRHLLFLDAAPLKAPIQGSTEFSKWFQNRGRKDFHGRPLREWDLKTRLFKYRLSYLIDTPLFDGLPLLVKQRMYERLWNLLSTTNLPADFPPIPAEERIAILEIVRHLKNDLPREWRDPE